jgi:hypothetical protein
VTVPVNCNNTTAYIITTGYGNAVWFLFAFVRVSVVYIASHFVRLSSH